MARQVRNAITPGTVILVYHRVTHLPTDPQRLTVTPEHFHQHLQVLLKHARPLALSELLAHVRAGRRIARGVAITFDDGYADNLTQAKPILQRHGIKATVYVISSFVGSNREFFWDELDRLLLQGGKLPEILDLKVAGSQYRWQLDAQAKIHRAYWELCDVLRTLDHPLRQQVLAELRAWAGVAQEARHTHRTMSPQQLCELARGDVVEIGSHTVTHPLLSARTPQQQTWEIQQSKKDLEQILGLEVKTFSYPFGTRVDYSHTTVALVCQAGFQSACSNFQAVVRPRTDPYQLPRHLVRDWDGQEFQRNLSHWFANG